MLIKDLIVFLVSMVPLIELRGAIPIAVGIGLPKLQSFIIAIIGNMLPVPIIYLFARKVLVWGSNKKYMLQETIPYEGAKPMYLVDDVDNSEQLKEIIIDTCKDLASKK